MKIVKKGRKKMFQNADDSIQWCCTIAANQRIKRVKKEEKEKKIV